MLKKILFTFFFFYFSGCLIIAQNRKMELILPKGQQGRLDLTCFSPNDKYLLTAGSTNNSAFLWNLQTESVQAKFYHESFLRSVCFSPDGKFILTAGGRIAKIWDAQSFI